MWPPSLRITALWTSNVSVEREIKVNPNTSSYHVSELSSFFMLRLMFNEQLLFSPVKFWCGLLLFDDLKSNAHKIKVINDES